MTLLSVQYLRGCAALMIVFIHLELQLKRAGYSGYWPTFLSAGVDIFFVISGFIMWITTANGMSALEFFRRRFFRIVPLYWLLTSIVLVTLVSFPKVVQSGHLDRWHVFGSYLFIPVVHPILGIMQPLLIPGWTLNYEMFFYVIFGFALLLPANVRLIVVSVILVVLSSVSLFVNVAPLTIMEFYTFSRVLEFAYGMALGWIYVRGIRHSLTIVWIAWACLLLGIGAITQTASYFDGRGLLVGVPALLIVAGAVMIEHMQGMPNIRGIHFLGNASYSLYLSHPIVISIVNQIYRKGVFDRLPGALFIFACLEVASSIAGASLIYLYIEVPLLQLGRLKIFSTVSHKAMPKTSA